MTVAVGAVLLAIALLVSSPATRRPLWKRPRRSRVGRNWALLALAPGAVAVAVVSPLVGGALGVAAVVITGHHRRTARERRRRREGDAVAAVVEVLAGELSAGAHPVRALAVAATESVGAFGNSLATVAGRARLGADVAQGLRSLAETSAVPMYWERIAICWQLGADHGLAMSVLMRTAHRDIVERQRFADRVRAGSAGARATASILSGLPVLGVLLGQLVGAHPFRFLLGSGPGGVLLMIGTALIGLGTMWSDHIIGRASL